MVRSKLIFGRKTDLFGTTITLSNRQKTYQSVLVDNFDIKNPLKNQNRTIKTGYWFRSPNIQPHDWGDTFRSLAACEGKFNLSAELWKDKTEMVVAWVRFALHDDAALFAWTNVSVWQKWDQKLEEESRQKISAPKIKIHKDGRITATVNVTDIED